MKINSIVSDHSYQNVKDSITLEGGGHAVIKKREVHVANNYDYVFPEGLVNPIERRTITKIICIDSVFRPLIETTHSNNFLWTLANPQNNVISMKIVAMELPNMIYAFSDAKQNNTFRVNLFNITGQADTSILVIIPEGNYMSDEFETMMRNLFQCMGQGLQYLHFDINVSDSKSIIRAITSTDGNYKSLYDDGWAGYSPNFYFVLDFDIKSSVCNVNYAYYKNAGWMMGFRHKTYTVTINNVYTDNISTTSPIIYQGFLKGESSYGSSIHNYIFIVVDDFNKNFITDSITSPVLNKSYIGNNILARITMSNGFNSIINDNASDQIFKMRQYLGPINLEKMQISLVDKFGDLIDLNKNNYSLAIELTILY